MTDIYDLVSTKYNIDKKELFFYKYDCANPYGDFGDVKHFEDVFKNGAFFIIYPDFYNGNDYVSEKPVINPTMIDIYYHLHMALTKLNDRHHVFLEIIEETQYKGTNALSLVTGS